MSHQEATEKKAKLVRLLREREWRKQRDLQRWGVQPERGIVAGFLDHELIDGSLNPCRSLRNAWAPFPVKR